MPGDYDDYEGMYCGFDGCPLDPGHAGPHTKLTPDALVDAAARVWRQELEQLREGYWFIGGSHSAFDRDLAAFAREQRARALEEAARGYGSQQHDGSGDSVRGYLRRRAEEERRRG